MNSFVAYIRVSTVRQGEKGSSLQEQRDAIKAFAARHGLLIVQWFEEMETAAKLGRREFARMLAVFKKGKMTGVIFHKIDRGARNLKDWNDIQELIERGIDVRFAHESLDMNTRGGRLTADLLAVIASDYIRNLRDEVRKGIRGRLKQGIYPLGAPFGYLNQGGGKPKIPDPVRAPLIRLAFELYAGGRYSLGTLADELYRRGLRTKADTKFGVNRLSELLRRPFYIGIIRMKRSGETYPGIHEPIVSKSLFDRVQAMLSGKANTKAIKHDLLFRRLIRCEACGYALIGERQKGHVYYRCHGKTCLMTGIREEKIEASITKNLHRIAFTSKEAGELRTMTLCIRDDWARQREEIQMALTLKRQNTAARLSRLTDAYLDGAIDRNLFETKKETLLLEQRSLEEQSTKANVPAEIVSNRLLEFIELAKALPLSYEMAEPTEKREIINSITSNLTATTENVAVALRSPFREIAERETILTSALDRDRPRTCTFEVCRNSPSLKKSRTGAHALLHALVHHFGKEGATGTA